MKYEANINRGTHKKFLGMTTDGSLFLTDSRAYKYSFTSEELCKFMPVMLESLEKFSSLEIKPFSY